MDFIFPKIYPITDVRISGLSHVEQVEKLIAGGASLIQLREKLASPREFYESAFHAVKIAKERNIRVVINDRVDIALALEADGVHLGQDDMPPEKAREILGDDAIIGFSTHSVKQALRALKLPVNYIAIGPIFQTQTKSNTDAIIGLNGLRKVRDTIGDFPLVAIGGINETNLRGVFEAGADSAAMIDALVSDPAKIEELMRQFVSSSAIRN